MIEEMAMSDQRVPALNLENFDMTRERGFLPSTVLWDLPNQFVGWRYVDDNFSMLLAANVFRRTILSMPVVDLSHFGESHAERAHLERVMAFFSFAASAYVWENWRQQPENRIPGCLAVPLCQIAKKLKRPPILSYASYCLNNWVLIDRKGPVELGNIALIQNFLSGLDEEWFVLVHVDIEAKAAPALVAIGDAQLAVADDKPIDLLYALCRISDSLDEMHKTLCRMPENCDPYIYYNRVRPYITGFSRHPVVYEGVDEFGGQPQKFFGETGAQSSVVPSLDAALGIKHNDPWPENFILRMRDYMPPKHRAFIEAVEQGPSIRECVLKNRQLMPELWKAYEECVERLRQFRDKHLEYAALYINKQAQKSPHNPVDYGTGGTPMMVYLDQHRRDTVSDPTALKEEAHGQEVPPDGPHSDNPGDESDDQTGPSRVSRR